MPQANPLGYSGKPLYQKLGLRPGMRCLALDPPAHYPELLNGAEGVTFLETEGPAEMVHLFCPDRATLEARHQSAFAACAEGGMVWISWPKKSSPLYRDLTEDTLREIILPGGIWVDTKVCAVDRDWSGLKFLRRKS